MTTFTCEASTLAKALRDVSAIVTREKMIILNNVLIEATKDGVKVTACTMDMMISCAIPSDVQKVGAFTVPATRFRDVVSALPDGAQAKLVYADDFAVLTAGRSRFKFSTLPATDFPKLPFDEPADKIEVGSDFTDALEAVRHAFSTNETQYWLCGAFIHKRDGIFRITALDMNRLSMRNLGAIDAEIPDTIMATKTVAELLRLTKDFDRTIELEFADGRVRCIIGDTVLTAKTIDAPFPKFDHIIPKDQPIVARANSAALSKALGRIQILSDDKERTVKLEFSKDKVTIQNRGLGDHGIEEVPCDYDGDDLAISFRVQQLRDAIDAIDMPEIGLEMSGPLAPMLVTGRENATIVISAMIN